MPFGIQMIEKFRAVCLCWYAALFVCLAGTPGYAFENLTAWRLFAEHDYAAARREALRELASEPENSALQFVAHASACRLNRRIPESVAGLEKLAGADSASPWAERSALELGRLYYLRSEPELAVEWYTRAFAAAQDDTVFRQAADALNRIFRVDESLASAHPELFHQVRTVDVSGAPDRRRKQRRGRFTARIVRFYRRNIGPAIGQRCVLHPSCSEYFMQAGRAHGVLGLPLIADRLVREPGVASRAEHPVQVGGHVRYADPVKDHTFWLRDVK